MRILILIILLSLLSCKCLALPEVIRIGGMFDSNDERQELAFRYAVEKINANNQTLPRSRLQAVIERISSDCSFDASKKACELLSSEVAGIFGPQSKNTAVHVQSICDAKEVPHIETRWDYKLRRRDEYSINLYPHPETLSQAYFDVINSLKWGKFALIYDDISGLVRLQTLLKMDNWTVTFWELNKGDNWRPLLREIKMSGEKMFVVDVCQPILYQFLKQANQIGLMREGHSYFITSLDMNLVDLEDFRYGGTNITALRLFDPNKPKVKKVVEDWMYGEFNRHGRTLSSEMKQITTEAALMHDAVYLFAQALHDLNRSKEFNTLSLDCEGDKTWQHGSSLINYMKWFGSRCTGDTVMPNGVHSPSSISERIMNIPPDSEMARMSGLTRAKGMSNKFAASGMTGMNVMTGMNGMMDTVGLTGIFDRSMFSSYESGMRSPNLTSESQFGQVHVHGLTGFIRFDAEGFRTDVELEITELDQQGGMKKVGIWTKNGGANYTRSLTITPKREGVIPTLVNSNLKVITAIADPYTRLKKSTKKLSGNERYEGFCIDLIEKVAEILKFNYTFKLEEDNKYGNKDEKTGEWDGMIKALLDGEADLGIVDFTITHERKEAVDFSMPFMDLGIGIVYIKPQKLPPSLFSFASPFSRDVWIYMGASYFGVSVLLFMLARITPEEWDNPYPCIQDPEELENSISLSNSFWFTIGSLMQQGSDIAPKAMSTRIVAGIWWFFTLIMISSYTANLAAFLTVEQMYSPIEGADDLSRQSKIKYGCKDGGATKTFFSESKISPYDRMWKAMSTAEPSVFTSTNDEGIIRVKNSEGKYAFLMESSSIEYAAERHCEIMQVGGLLDSKSYGIGLPPNSPHTRKISEAILDLKEKGTIHDLKTKWWKRDGGGRCVSDDSSSTGKAAELGLSNVGGVFVVLIGGMGISALVAVCEFLWNARELATDENVSFCEELGNEVNFILKCSGNTKPVRKTQSPTPEEPLFTYGSNNYDSNYAYGGNKK